MKNQVVHLQKGLIDTIKPVNPSPTPTQIATRDNPFLKERTLVPKDQVSKQKALTRNELIWIVTEILITH